MVYVGVGGGLQDYASQKDELGRGRGYKTSKTERGGVRVIQKSSSSNRLNTDGESSSGGSDPRRRYPTTAVRFPPLLRHPPPRQTNPSSPRKRVSTPPEGPACNATPRLCWAVPGAGPQSRLVTGHPAIRGYLAEGGNLQRRSRGAHADLGRGWWGFALAAMVVRGSRRRLAGPACWTVSKGVSGEKRGEG